eukprot:scaffold120563_cov36-Phaeocystis_antarctica.AAC.1
MPPPTPTPPPPPPPPPPRSLAASARTSCAAPCRATRRSSAARRRASMRRCAARRGRERTREKGVERVQSGCTLARLRANHTRLRLQPYVTEAATIRDRRCNHRCGTLAHLGAIVDEAARRRSLIALQVREALVLLALALVLGLGRIGDEEVLFLSCCGSAPSRSCTPPRRAGIYPPLRCPPATGPNRARRLTRHACGGHRIVLERACFARPHATRQG